MKFEALFGITDLMAIFYLTYKFEFMSEIFRLIAKFKYLTSQPLTKCH